MKLLLRRALFWMCVVLGVLFAAAVLDICIAELLNWIESTKSPVGIKQFHYWIQIVTGNWSEQGDVFPAKSFQFSLVESTAIVLNFSLIAAVFGLIADLIRRIDALRKEYAMRLTDALTLRDRALKEEIYNSVPEAEQERMIALVEAAFQKGNEVWAREYLPIAFPGRNQAAAVLAQIGDINLG